MALVTELRALREPSDGVPSVVATPAELAEVCQRFADGSGPVAVDAERASGYRYGQRAYLVQLRRAGAGTALIDPIPLSDLSSLTGALGTAEWVVHAASQDLACLAEVGFVPGGELFDTELAARLAGLERVGLAAIVEHFLGWQLAKEHSAADWSKRPLPVDWLRYAALDVEVLVEVRDALADLLADQGKLDWAREEFAAVRDSLPKPARTDPWRRTAGTHKLRSRRQVAVLRELWLERDRFARSRDIAPGRLLPDRAIIQAAAEMPSTRAALVALPVFSGPANRRNSERWLGAITRGLRLPDSALPPMNLRSEGPPPPRAWADRDPDAAARLAAARAVVAARSAEYAMPAENLISPDLVRRLCWTPPATPTADAVRAALGALGARTWQIDLLVEGLTDALQADAASAAAQLALREAQDAPDASAAPDAPTAQRDPSQDIVEAS